MTLLDVRDLTGDVVFDGESLLPLAPHEVARRRIGHTFQAVHLFKTMSVLDNVVLGAQTGTPWRDGQQARVQAPEALDYLGLGIGLNLLGTYADFVTPELKLPIALAVLLGILIVRPTGLFGRPAVPRV